MMRSIASLAIVALLSGCGFHLQGRTPLPEPLALTFVETQDEQTEFVQALREALTASGARLAARSEDAGAVVRILSDDVQERVLSVSARNLPREYELIHTVRFQVRARDRELLPEQRVSATRDFSFDERALLAKENEEAILRQALARDLVGIVMRRLSSL